MRDETGTHKKPKVGSNKAAMDRRLNTSPVLTFRWHSLALGFIAIGVFILINAIMYIVMDIGGQPRYLGIFSCVRIPNDYDPDVIRKIYYVDGRVIMTLFVPGIVLLISGCAMQIIRMISLKKTVDAAVKKRKDEINKI